jgi:hypothetical protein
MPWTASNSALSGLQRPTRKLLERWRAEKVSSKCPSAEKRPERILGQRKSRTSAILFSLCPTVHIYIGKGLYENCLCALVPRWCQHRGRTPGAPFQLPGAKYAPKLSSTRWHSVRKVAASVGRKPCQGDAPIALGGAHCALCVIGPFRPFTSVTRVQIPSGTHEFFRSLRDLTADFGSHQDDADGKMTNSIRENARFTRAAFAQLRETCPPDDGHPKPGEYRRVPSSKFEKVYEIREAQSQYAIQRAMAGNLR